MRYITNNKKEVKSKKEGNINIVYFTLLDLYKYQRNFKGLMQVYS